jgi:hypothetical protein
MREAGRVVDEAMGVRWSTRVVLVAMVLAVMGCERRAGQAAPPRGPPVDAGPAPTTVTVGRTADGGFSFQVSRGEVFWLEQCQREDFEVWRAMDGGAWQPLELYYVNPNFKGGRILLDNGPPPKRTGEWGACANEGFRHPARQTSFEWSGNHLAPGDVVERAPPGHYRFSLPGASQEFDIPLQ